MLAAMGANITTRGTEVRVEPLAGALLPASTAIPADLSGAAFWLVAASLHPEARIDLPGVGTNPTRMGIIDVLRAMGADIRLENERTAGGEPVADISVRSAPLHGTTIAGDLVPRVIDEIPVLALAAALAEGETVIADAAELRVKESDRIMTTVTELRKFGAAIDERPDGMVIRGVRELRGASCRSYGDHRLAMTLAVAGLVSAGTTVLSGSDAVDVSYPEFWTDLDRLSSISVRS
jgi:3-phosphoshikimate 1-carboxyvinyltransferase